ncbi:MAG: polysaccharide deacetylase family protein [Verrucomicrobia bacterium]|nr:polysaccharide deacetylase family protein [Verrucomicrobiota bacterium]
MANSEIGSRAEVGRKPHLLTFDVEDWHRGMGVAPRGADSHLETAMDSMLEVLDGMGVRATFFVLGEDALRIQVPLQRCAEAGHEVASHGMHHVRVDTMDATAFRRDISEASARLEDITQKPCRGYRAPWFSLRPEMAWAFEVLAEEGMAYDASLRLPLKAGPPRAVADAGLVEVPVPTLRYPWGQFGILSGLLLRLLPHWAVRAMLDTATRAGVPGCVYLHPYEWEQVRPAPAGPMMKVARRRLLVSRTLPILQRSAGHVAFMSIEKWLSLRSTGRPESERGQR